MEIITELSFQNQIEDLAKQANDLIVSCLSKQEGFIGIEESKHLIKSTKMMYMKEIVSIEYFFDGKHILTIYPPNFNQENGRFTASVNYKEY